MALMSTNATPRALPVPVPTGWLTPVQLGAELGRSPATLKDWRRTGYGPAFSRRGKLILYRREAVEEWLLEAERGNTCVSVLTIERGRRRITRPGAVALVVGREDAGGYTVERDRSRAAELEPEAPQAAHELHKTGPGGSTTPASSLSTSPTTSAHRPQSRALLRTSGPAVASVAAGADAGEGA